MKQFMMYVLFAVFAVVAALWSVFWIISGDAVWAFFVPIVVSLVGIYALRRGLEENEPKGLFNPRIQSWAFMFGDGIALPLAFVFLTKGLQGVGGLDGVFYGWRWVIVAACVGTLMGVAFHIVDGQAYTGAGAAEALSSPTKIYHDLVVYPVLGASLVFAGIPQVVQAWTVWTVLSVLAILSWIVLGLLDGRRGLDPLRLHPLWSVANFQPK